MPRFSLPKHSGSTTFLMASMSSGAIASAVCGILLILACFLSLKLNQSEKYYDIFLWIIGILSVFSGGMLAAKKTPTRAIAAATVATAVFLFFLAAISLIFGAVFRDAGAFLLRLAIFFLGGIGGGLAGNSLGAKSSHRKSRSILKKHHKKI